MKTNRQFTNLFLSSASSGIQQNSSFSRQSMIASHYFDRAEKPFQPHKIYTSPSVRYQPLRVSQTSYHSNNKPQSNLRQSHIVTSGVYTLQRSKSQIIQPIYYTSFKNTQNDKHSETSELGLSKVSQVTFSKPSDFIINLQKSNHFVQSSPQILIQPPSRIINDYCQPDNNISYNKVYLQNQRSNLRSPLKNSCIIEPSKINNNNAFYNNRIPQFNFIQKPRLFSKTNIFRKQSPNTIRIFNNGINTVLQSDYCNPPKSISNRSRFMDIRNISCSPVTKIKFNYISPAKSQNKAPRKLSFKKQDIKNPTFKLLKKKKDLKNKKSVIEKDNQKQVINQYFPEFKIKKNKLKTIRTSNKNDPANQDYDNKTQKSSQDERRHTFIAGLQGFSQISQIKKKQELIEGSTATPKKLNQNSQSCQNESQNSPNETQILNITELQKKQKLFKKPSSNKGIKGYRITLDGKRVQIESNQNKIKDEKINNQTILKRCQESRNSSLSVDSLRGDIGQFLKSQKDSSHTTDHQDQIVKKIKNDLGLNFSYYKK